MSKRIAIFRISIHKDNDYFSQSLLQFRYCLIKTIGTILQETLNKPTRIPSLE